MNPAAAPRRRLADLVLIVLFLGGLSLPALGPLLHLEPAVAAVGDRRTLAPLPHLTLKRDSLKWFPVAFEDYYRDHFGYRNALLWAHLHFEVSCLHVSPSQQVVLGKPGWLYLSNPTIGAHYDMTRPLTDDELARWQKALEARRDHLARQGCRYLLVVVPEKQTIYPEHLPPRLRAAAVGVRLAQFQTYLQAHSDLDFVDLVAPLKAAKPQDLLYHATDSHWNQRGAFVAYRETAGRLAEWFPVIHPLARSDFAPVEREYLGDLGLILNQVGKMREAGQFLQPLTPRRARTTDAPYPAAQADVAAGHTPIATEIDDPALPRGVVFHDSFMVYPPGGILPFLSEHFRRLVYVFKPIGKRESGYSREVVEAERPEVVIQEFAERELNFALPEDLQPEGESP